jgi:hypothetical protein
MKMKRYDFTSFEQFEQSGTAGEYEVVTVIDEYGWMKSDIITECRSWKIALRRFFEALGEDSRLEGWYESMREGAENGYAQLNDFTLGNGNRNDCPSYAYEIEEIQDGVWYIFLNIKYE